jgi:hypothetical protein
MGAAPAERADRREVVLLQGRRRALWYPRPQWDSDVRHLMFRAAVAAALLAASLPLASPAKAQAPAAPQDASAPRRTEPSPAAPAAPAGAPAPSLEPRVVKAREVTVITGSRFRVGKDRYQVFGVRSPRPRTGQCVMERLRGRQSRAALRRIMSRGEIRIVPTGQTNAFGDQVARVWVDGQSVARRLINARAAVARRPGQNYNPWCISLRRQPTPPELPISAPPPAQ